MAVPVSPSVTTICTTGLQRGGQYNPSSTQITMAADHFLQEVKADIMRIAPNHDHFAATATAPTVRGQQRYSIPADHNRSHSLLLMAGPEAWQGTAQTGGSSTVTLPATFDESDETVAGKWIGLTGGTGSGQYRQILSYNNTTKIATVDTAWTTTPASNTTFVIGTEQTVLYPHTYAELLDRSGYVQSIGKPCRASLFNQEFYLLPTPDSAAYMLIHHYYVDLSKLDEASDLFAQLLREWRSLFIQGIAAYTMQRYDDERFPQAWGLYQAELHKLGADSPQYHQTMGHR